MKQGYLALRRLVNEKILIGDDIEIIVVEAQGRGSSGSVILGIKAPSGVAIDREEVRLSKIESGKYPKKGGA